jgi:hypothetical protein
MFEQRITMHTLEIIYNKILSQTLTVEEYLSYRDSIINRENSIEICFQEDYLWWFICKNMGLYINAYGVPLFELIELGEI